MNPLSLSSHSGRLDERWRVVGGYAERYEVSDFGRVRLTKTRRILRSFFGPKDSDCLYIDLRYGSVRRRHSIASLVATAFLPTAPAGCLAAHRSDDTEDNRASNLEWVTQGEHTARWLRRKPRRRAADGVFAGVREALEEYTNG